MTESMETKISSQDDSLKAQRRKAAKPLLWVSIAGMAMMFAGLTSGYVVSRTSLVEEGRWLEFEIPSIFWMSTVVVVSISAILHFALKAAKNDNRDWAARLLAMALGLSFVFVVVQYFGYQALYDSGVFFTGPGSNTAGSWVYLITFFHLLHLVAGIIVLLVTFIKASTGYYSKENYLGIDLCATYWHFVDALWIYLFIFLSIFR
jgi:cytochrome c oxidase subunit 3